ncbi:hypothetical protein FA13DRAFT_1817070 [Coprinellus micaceus]|uniref:Uncharacterized protein n=1 Tax=Coprinellus micaceus TaxID=71717 RepID=A0A4Y7SX35_COPMI|nr:hypothetical protein FA13DRAFT_1817070 [Coprinellus micaceus]
MQITHKYPINEVKIVGPHSPPPRHFRTMHNPYILQTGPLIMGTLLGFFLNGVFVHATLCVCQTPCHRRSQYRFALDLDDYYSGFHSPEKHTFVYVVGVVAVIEALHLAFSTRTFYSTMAEGFGNPDVFVSTPLSSAAMPALNGAVGLCTQIFFACRILLLSKMSLGKVAACLVGLCSAAIGLSVQLSLLSHSIALSHSLKTTVTVWLSASVACDLIICIAITTILLRQRLSVNYTPS